ncbi:endonuclease [Flagellimonas sp. DF-77]|uniref:endonuclease/exonuclease/phosphatase family protein n=1 Tax=Flagellimonas algarum TaxID=3230298 RepID=UPI003391D48D
MKEKYTVAFYNLENLFDAKDDPYTLDDDFTPSGFKKWNEKKLTKKLGKLAKAISEIGKEEIGSAPTLVGIAEVENNAIIERLLQTEPLNGLPYDYVHFDSPDERGIDTALLYHREHFKVLDKETLPLLVTNEEGVRDYTRDILYVYGELNGEPVHLFVNHWPSRRDGADETEHKRVLAAQTVLERIDRIEEYAANLMVMGDFNDDPNSKSIKTLMESGLFINPMQQLLSPNSGSANYKGKWNLFDQVLVSHSFLNYEKGTHSFKKAAIFSPRFLQEWKGKYKGNPFRTFVGRKHIGGYSDHFPVYVVLKYND